MLYSTWSCTKLLHNYHCPSASSSLHLTAILCTHLLSTPLHQLASSLSLPKYSCHRDEICILLPGMDLPRGQWSLLNMFRTDAGPCLNSMHEWGYIASPLCDCGQHQTMRHIVNECPLTCFDGGISELHQAHDAAFNWLLRRYLRS